MRQLRITTHQGDEFVFDLEGKLTEHLAEEIAEQLYGGADIAEVDVEDNEIPKRPRKKFRPDNEGALRRAFPSDYAKWLKKHLELGGKVTHRREYAMPGDYYVARQDIEIPPLYGANSIYVIAPRGVEVSAPHGLGHSAVYDMETGQSRGSGIVGSYQDTSVG